ncbi:arsenic resistance N-acetyltransferase ArsN2 [Xanthomonas indica]|uniref:Arsenic resistance N-acetyltransferase ArsN2 n=1 Tax=Xanthomonas indica TaxID=2912242 RepID=A0AAU8I7B1_9XANT|nr:arsenic resistance N-acetyltransferase ArsN2 [Xanthomonas indica]MCI2260619.1 arsenic resistance N-acetyltransferase ArsN2 [Xanthomonas indica]
MYIAKSAVTSDIVKLLEASGLPTEDLLQGRQVAFFVTGDDAGAIGCIGLELGDGCALLRSLAVRPEARGAGLGGKLVDTAEDHARTLGLFRIFLITNSAGAFFEARGYHAVERATLPPFVGDSTQLRNLCPASAAVMLRCLPPG